LSLTREIEKVLKEEVEEVVKEDEMEKLTDQEKQVIVGLISRVNVSPIDENAEENIKVRGLKCG